MKRSLPLCIAITRNNEPCQNRKLPTHDFCHIPEHRYQVEENRLKENQVCTVSQRHDGQLGEAASTDVESTVSQLYRSRHTFQEGLNTPGAGEDRTKQASGQLSSLEIGNVGRKARWQREQALDREIWTGYLNETARLANIQTQQEHRRMELHLSNGICQISEQVRAAVDILTEENGRIVSSATDSLAQKIQDLSQNQAQADIGAAVRLHARYKVELDAVVEISKAVADLREGQARIKMELAQGQAAFADLQSLPSRLEGRTDRMIEEKLRQTALRQNVQEAATKEIKRLCLEIQTTLAAARDRDRGTAEMLAQEMRELGRELMKDLRKEAQDSIAAAVAGGRHELQSMIEGVKSTIETVTLIKQPEQLQAPSDNDGPRRHTISEADLVQVLMEQKKGQHNQDILQDLGEPLSRTRWRS